MVSTRRHFLFFLSDRSVICYLHTFFVWQMGNGMNAFIDDGYINITSFFYSDKLNGWFPMDEHGNVYYRDDNWEEEEFSSDEFDEEVDYQDDDEEIVDCLRDGNQWSHDFENLHKVRIQNCNIIPENAFSHCHNLETVIMDDLVEKIEPNAFHKCEALIYVRMSANIQQIGPYAFFHCPKITSLFIPDSCLKIEDAAFKGCRSIHIVSVSSTTQLGKYVVMNCKDLFEHSPFDHADLSYHQHNDNINNWLRARFHTLPLHTLCSSPHIRSLKMHLKFQEVGKNAGVETDYQKMNALHILMSSPYVKGQDDSILATYLKHCPEAGIALDVFERTPLECLEQKIVGCTVNMVETYTKYCPEIRENACYEHIRSKSYHLLNSFGNDRRKAMMLKVFQHFCPKKDHLDLIDMTMSYLMNNWDDYYPPAVQEDE